MFFSKEKFDSEILGKDIFKLFLEKEFSKGQLISVLNKCSIKKGAVFCFSIFSNKNINLLESFGFNLISIRNTYIYRGSSPSFFREDIKNSYKLFSSSDGIRIKAKDLLELALIIGKTSRYFKDNKISKKKALDIYVSWLKNSLFNNYVDEYFGIMKGNVLIGIITIKIRDKKGFIDLIGVREGFQNLGLGSLLLNKSLAFLKKKKIEEIFVVTEGENIAANAFYQKNDFILSNVELVFHKHF